MWDNFENYFLPLIRMKLPLLIFIVAAILIGCGTIKPAASEIKPDAVPGEIVFHLFNAGVVDGEVIIEEKEKTIREGQIKERQAGPENFHHPVEVVFLTNSGRRIKSIFIEHPLIREYEYLHQDGELKRVTSIEGSADFTLRYNAVEQAEGILFSSFKKDTLAVQVKLELKK